MPSPLLRPAQRLRRPPLLLSLLLASLSLLHSAQEIDPYEILGLSDDATDGQVKKAYRQMSIKHHPDKGGSAAKFKEVSAAYEVLRDGEKRALYDAGGMAAVEKGSGGTDMWGRPVGVQKGQAVEVTVRVPLEDMYRGGNVRAHVRRRIVCRGCRNGPRLAKCEGCGPTCPNELKTMPRRMGPMIVNQEVEVPSEERCKDEPKTLHAVIERGVDNGYRITFERASEHSPGQIPGDVHLVLQAHPHAVFRREGRELHMTLKISLKQALLGFRRTIRHLDGHEVVISNETPVSYPKQVLLVRGEGMPVHNTPSEFGDLHVEISVEFPKALTQSEKDFVAKHFVDGAGV